MTAKVLHHTLLFALSQIASCLLGLHVLPQFIVGLHSQSATKTVASAVGKPIKVPDVHFQLASAHDKDHGSNVIQLGILLFYTCSMFSMYLLCTSISEQSTPALFVFRSVVGVLVGIPLFYVSAVLFGAPVFELLPQTMMWSVIQSMFVLLPLAAAQHFDLQVWKRVYALNDARTAFEMCASWGGIGSMVGAWSGACLIPLDWDAPWQKWPIPLIYGGSVGFVVGHVCAYLRVKFLLQQEEKLNSVFHRKFVMKRGKHV